MNQRELCEAFVVEARKREGSRMQTPVTWKTIGDFFESAINPRPEEPIHVPHFVAPVIPPEFPKLKVKYKNPTGEALEWVIVQNGDGENPYREWSTEKMGMREDLIARGIAERPAEEWQRRKQFAEKGRQ